ncbi:T9SS type A sorting domain-containing protein [Chryseobacterium sp. SIMBA_038]|uniref:T9SS type A sorting domain-containing protein n=3 Tax=Bacteria TaxID=2 RepID=UPI003978A4DD
MRKAFTLLFVFLELFLFSQTTMFGPVSGLAFRKNSVKQTVLQTDTLQDRLINYHLIKDNSSQNFFKKLSVSLNQPTFFMVGNKFGGTENKVYAKIGSSVISNLGITDFSDSLKVTNQEINSKILTFTKRDVNKRINPIVFFNKRTDKKILIPEVLVFDNNLSDIDTQKIETYLSIKYGITINNISEKNYISSSDQILWDSKKNKNYNFRITGIGRDDAFELYQKQSTNSNEGNVTVAIDSLKLTNNFNTGTIENGNFLLWGDNNQALTFKEADLLSQHPGKDMLRMWKMQNRSGNGQVQVTNMYAVLPAQPSGNSIRLRVFQSETDYQNDISANITGKKINDTLYVFKDILWDVNKDGIDYFTFSLNDNQSDLNIQLASNCEDLGNNLIKISVPANIIPFDYSLQSLTTNQMVVNMTQGTNNQLVFNNLNPDNYKLVLKKQGYNDIVRTFDLQGVVNQNIDTSYLWEGTPIELDLNTGSFQYVLTRPNGQTTTIAPYFLNGTGNYQLKIKNKLGCEVIKNLTVLNRADYESQQTTSLFKKIQVSPNPSRDGNISIRVELKSAKPLTVKVFNSMGVLVKQGQYNSASEFTIPMSIPPVAGYYSIKVFIPEEGKGVNFIIY